ncbi:hypothetical protein TPHA_0F01750 [Tetrapisispora phaffii CBS 4417]|uniref:phosphoinositide 5-phosphatase n=1 Tax=Tetrapisispora phaffii (strain ATCC 24235 / CBS 4417 / NBRC 1672 / NRRL Y-8282 / UCD 70-5) TaxID=1071381 RepID=G8BV77_TETPH|nr:hypothetical protein TPHA_0F01750 [Tetrapisispora phaffii CBS 4417]CCE63659.1 hypothetical protein TPHA_0F01750 [Tetrapisispora phaffii CBS 4417]
MIIILSTTADRRLAIVSENHAIVFKAISEPSSKKPICNIELAEKKTLRGHGFQKLSSHEIFGFIGLIEVNGLIFIGTIVGKSKVAQPVPGESINKINSVEFYCLNDPTWDFTEFDANGYPLKTEQDSSEVREPIPRHPLSELRKLLSNGSFYYSSDFDLTATLQSRGYGAHSLSSDKYETEYMWNYFLMQDIIEYRDRLDNIAKQILDDNGFLTTMICGFAETFITAIEKTKVAITIISKQSWKRAGTRFNARGVDDDANVANFVETETVMYSLHYCYSFTQIRGSIPVFWEQENGMINPKVEIRRSIEATQPIFDKHFENLNNKYGHVNIVNLLAYKPSEIELSKRYHDHLKNSKKFQFGEDVSLTDFDFHKETSGEGFAGVRKLIPLITESMLSLGYFSYDIKEQKVLSEQHGVFRTNCLDCLDRTNVVQQAISKEGFKIFLEDFRLKSSNDGVEDEDVMNKLNELWADNGDQISQIYTGTNALKSSYSRKGKMSLSGILSDATKSVSRIYINNFVDTGKQHTIDFLLGRLPNQLTVQLFDPVSQYISKELSSQSDKFTTIANIEIFAGTFNVSAATDNIDLTKWLFPVGERFKPDVFVLGLQEVIELSAGSILNADYTKGHFWESMVSKCLNKFGDKYLLLRVEQVTSLLILLFVHVDKVQNFKEVEGASKKTGFGGIAGNKGAVSIRFNYGDTSFCFINSHLSAGDNNVEDRKNDYWNILNGINFTRSKTISDHDNIFWLGDLNFRVNLDSEIVRYELEKKKDDYINGLLKYDQLRHEIMTGEIFKGFKEAPIKFRPTYKYDKGTENYDSSEKARTPSWTDRILYKGEDLSALSYSDALILDSDHRPVYGAYRVITKFSDNDKKKELVKLLYTEFQRKHSDLVLTNIFSKSDSGLSLNSTPASNEDSNGYNIEDLDLSRDSFRTLMSDTTTSSKLNLRPPPPPLTEDVSSNSDCKSPESIVKTISRTESLTNKERPLPPGFNDGIVLTPGKVNEDGNK